MKYFIHSGRIRLRSRRVRVRVVRRRQSVLEGPRPTNWRRRRMQSTPPARPVPLPLLLMRARIFIVPILFSQRYESPENSFLSLSLFLLSFEACFEVLRQCSAVVVPPIFYLNPIAASMEMFSVPVQTRSERTSRYSRARGH